MKIKNLVAFVPMRHTSIRVPGKNYRPIAGKPLYAYILNTLLQVPEVTRIVVDTDSPVILEGLVRDYPMVIGIERPEHLRADTVPMNDVLLHDTSIVKADWYLQTHSTNPMLKPETIRQAIHALEVDYPNHDTLFGVTRLQTRLWDADNQPINHNPAELLRTQDLPPVFEDNSCLYLFKREAITAYGTRLGARPLMFEIPAAEAVDIDEELDFTIAAMMLEARKAAQEPAQEENK
ncbi:MAG: acylneuraminate cytidylyltransferase family protein [Anaerolineaceae bacterium]